MSQAYDRSGLCGKNARESKDRFNRSVRHSSAIQQHKGIILQLKTPMRPKPKSLHPHSFVILRPGNPDYTARDTMAAHFMPSSGALKDKCIQTH
jgi:hypothetical protein